MTTSEDNTLLNVWFKSSYFNINNMYLMPTLLHSRKCLCYIMQPYLRPVGRTGKNSRKRWRQYDNRRSGQKQGDLAKLALSSSWLDNNLLALCALLYTTNIFLKVASKHLQIKSCFRCNIGMYYWNHSHGKIFCKKRHYSLILNLHWFS